VALLKTHYVNLRRNTAGAQPGRRKPCHKGHDKSGWTLSKKFGAKHNRNRHGHLCHFEAGRANRATQGNTAEVSAFDQHDIEFAADTFADEYLMDKDGSVSAAVASKVAAPIYLLILAMKEAMLPAADNSAQARARPHPLSADRAEKLIPNNLPPAYMPQWQIYLEVPSLLRSVHSSPPFQIAAKLFSSRVASAASGRPPNPYFPYGSIPKASRTLPARPPNML
jgi:hypothetical protein